MKSGFVTRDNNILSLFTSICLVLIFSFQSCKKADIVPAQPPVIPKDSASAVTSVLKPVTFAVNKNIGGYYVGLPSTYNQTAVTYPLLVFIPGAGQFGNGSVDLPLLLKDGPAELIDEKRFPGTFSVNGKVYSFIVFTPQFKYYPSTADINDCIEYAKKTYRIDESRIYLSGLSVGGIETSNSGAEMPSKLAAIVPMAGVFPDYASTDKCQKIAAANLPVWAFHSDDDPQINISVAKGFIAKLNSFNPAIAPKLTVWPNGGHDAWTRALEPGYKENGFNIYEWMLQYQR